MKKLCLLTALAAFTAVPALADTIGISPIPVNGNAGSGGYHTITIDNASCKVKNSANPSVTGPQFGCNYKISLSGIGADGKGGTWTVVPEQNNGCSTKCE